mgnify:FL=1|jgi:hypothetical protein
MNEPIINPWIFYWMSVVDNLRSLIGFIGLLATGITMWFCLDWIVKLGDKDYSVKYKQKIKLFVCIGLVCAVLFALIPSQTTLTRMIVASYVTPQNIEIMQGEANKSVDYLINKIVEAGEKWEQRGKDD